MRKKYWENIADRYEDEIFDVSKHDTDRVIGGAIAEYGEPSHRASDLGCGIGGFLPALSETFESVLAVDISKKNIAKAKRECARFGNIDYRVSDLSKRDVALPKVDFALSVNSIITPSLKRRNRMFDAVGRHLKAGGFFVLVAPALESALLTDVRLIEWNLREGMKPKKALRSAAQDQSQFAIDEIHKGVIRIQGVKTKYYLKEELKTILKNRRLNILEIKKIKYHWKTQFASPPKWMKSPYPWDWMVLARKEGKK